MTSDRWRDLERLYHAALDRDPEQRGPFLAEACADDAVLRREVESLLAHHATPEAFLDTPATFRHRALLTPITTAMAQHEEFIPGRFVGRLFGVYRIEALIAAGGMGEVYRAIDTRLGRTVAIKTLPAHLSQDADRRQRLEREARIIARLNHPHICMLHDVGEQGDVLFLVMEYIDGETLRSRLARGALPLAEALQYAIQIADALDRAHRAGVIHRDLKPANVMLTSSGAKLLDFGVAMLGSIDHDRADGVIIATPQYASPEQINGQATDARTDIFAFGAIVHEMLSRTPGVPQLLAQTTARCLAIEADDRWQSARDVLFTLRYVASAGDSLRPAVAPHVVSRWRRRGWIAFGVSTVILAGALVGLAWWLGSEGSHRAEPATVAPLLVNLSPPAGMSFYAGHDLPFALSPDGRQIVSVVETPAGTTQLWLRTLSSDREQAIPGTDAATTPFWSPDGQWIGFFADKTLKKVRVSNGAIGLVQPIAANVETFAGAAWNADDVILFPLRPGGLSRVSAKGGPLTQVTQGNGGHYWPQFLADGTHFIYSASAPPSICIGSLAGEAPRTLMTFPVRASSLAHVPGYIFYVRDATLFARPFDETRREFSGEPLPLVENMPISALGRTPFSVSAAGVLAYWRNPTGTPAVLQWVTRDGHRSIAVETPAKYLGFALSPDTRQLVFSRTERNGAIDIWMRTLTDGRETQLTFNWTAFTPLFSPDGTRLAFSSALEGPPVSLFTRMLTDPGTMARVTSSPTPNFASSWSGDGRALVSVRIDRANGADLWLQRLPDGTAERLPLNTPFNETDAAVSPDNRWIAYVTDESGRDEVWIASFPSGSIRRRLSPHGGTTPQWTDGGREIVYVAADRQLMAASVGIVSGSDGDGPRIGQPRPLFRVEQLAAPGSLVFPTANAYAVTPNGQRFLVAVKAHDPNAPPITLIANWPALAEVSAR